jgi:hypothetical protein
MQTLGRLWPPSAPHHPNIKKYDVCDFSYSLTYLVGYNNVSIENFESAEAQNSLLPAPFFQDFQNLLG